VPNTNKDCYLPNEVVKNVFVWYVLRRIAEKMNKPVILKLRLGWTKWTDNLYLLRKVWAILFVVLYLNWKKKIFWIWELYLEREALFCWRNTAIKSPYHRERNLPTTNCGANHQSSQTLAMWSWSGFASVIGCDVSLFLRNIFTYDLMHFLSLLRAWWCRHDQDISW